METRVIFEIEKLSRKKATSKLHKMTGKKDIHEFFAKNDTNNLTFFYYFCFLEQTSMNFFCTKSATSPMTGFG